MNRQVVNCWFNDKCLVVLCNDGTLWALPETKFTWNKLPVIPTDDEYEKQVKNREASDRLLAEAYGAGIPMGQNQDGKR